MRKFLLVFAIATLSIASIVMADEVVKSTAPANTPPPAEYVPAVRSPQEHAVPIPLSLVFFDERMHEVGRIEWTNGVVSFHGKVKRSARIFFKYMTNTYGDPPGPR